MNEKTEGRGENKKKPGKLKYGKREGKILKKFSEGVKQAKEKSEKAKGGRERGKPIKNEQNR